jgi:hypothetical protein
MKTYTQFLDIIIVSLLVLAIRFNLSDDTITDSIIGRRGVIRTMIISWQTLLVVASFCVLLRYIARNTR